MTDPTRPTRAAGVTEFGGPVHHLELGPPPALAAGEVLIDVRAAGVGNWDDVVRAGSWDVGAVAPLALGVEAAGVITALGDETDGWRIGDEVLTHPLPLRWQGTWASQLIAPATLLARRPSAVSWAEAAAFPVPALTAAQGVEEALDVRRGQTLLVHGGGTVTGRIAIALGVAAGARVIATAGASSAARARESGAAEVLDHHEPDWPHRVRHLTDGRGVPGALNAGRGDEARTLAAVADGGRLATITGAPPPPERGIAISDVYVRPDGPMLRRLATLLGDGRIGVHVGATFGLDRAAAALTAAVAGGNGGAVVITL